MNTPGIMLERDDESGDYFVYWVPFPVAGLGLTEQEALEDLRSAAHLAVDCCVDEKLGDTA